jgi:hypothetical protein
LLGRSHPIRSPVHFSWGSLLPGADRSLRNTRLGAGLRVKLDAGRGRRRWAYWKFELGEDPPNLEEKPIRLAELGLLRGDEVVAIAERAAEARLRIGTDAERHGSGGRDRPDRRAVALHEAVERALRC